MQLNIDTTKSTFLAVSEPEVMVDPVTQAAKVSKEGKPMYMVQVVSLGGNAAEVMKVKVAGKPMGITVGIPVKITDLVASPWSMNDRSGIGFRAERIDPVSAKS